MSGTAPSGSFGALLKEAREARGMSQAALAQALNLPLHLVEALEAEDWSRVPPGRERPLARLLARHLGLDPEAHPEVWETLPGSGAQEGASPSQERLERGLTYALMAGSIALLAWLVVPGRDLKRSIPPGGLSRQRPEASRPWVRQAPTGPYPVLGEVLPEAPINEQGVLVNLRSLDGAEARITGENGLELHQTLRVSEPWRLRVKGPFTLSLDNAGVVAVEVANRPIPHGRNVGEPWTGSFSAEGAWLLPAAKPGEEAPPAPETEEEPAGSEED